MTRFRLPNVLKRLDRAAPALFWVFGIGMTVAGAVQLACWNPPSSVRGAIWFYGGMYLMAGASIVTLRIELQELKKKVANMGQPREGRS